MNPLRKKSVRCAGCNKSDKKITRKVEHLSFCESCEAPSREAVAAERRARLKESYIPKKGQMNAFGMELRRQMK